MSGGLAKVIIEQSAQSLAAEYVAGPLPRALGVAKASIASIHSSTSRRVILGQRRIPMLSDTYISTELLDRDRMSAITSIFQLTAAYAANKFSCRSLPGLVPGKLKWTTFNNRVWSKN